MKKLFFAFAAAALCLFSACSKEETENENATMDDFYGSYNVTIESTGLLGTNAETFKATLEIKKAAAEVLGLKLFESSIVADLDFSTTDTALMNREWYPTLDSVYGAVFNGYMNLACAKLLSSGKTILFKGNTIAYKTSTLTWDAYFGEKKENWLESLTSYQKLKFTATKK